MWHFHGTDKWTRHVFVLDDPDGSSGTVDLTDITLIMTMTGYETPHPQALRE